VLEDEGGRISTAKLAAAVFAPGAEAKLAALNRILHPGIIAAQEAELLRHERAGAKLAAVEAALLLEVGAGARFDKLVVVVAPEAERVRRFVARSGARTGASAEQARARMAAQWPDEKKVARADFVIRNDGALAATAEQVAEMLKELQT
ncbi:MAG: dephospho-CoA kinase, partial [Terriglobales bacterium]